MNNPEYLHGWFDDLVTAFTPGAPGEAMEASQQAQANLIQEQEQFKIEQRNQALKQLNDVKIVAQDPKMVEQILSALATLSYIAKGNTSVTDQWWSLEEPMRKATSAELYAQLINLSKTTPDAAASAILLEKAEGLYAQMEKMAPQDRGGDLPSQSSLWWRKNSTYVYLGLGGVTFLGLLVWWRNRD